MPTKKPCRWQPEFLKNKKLEQRRQVPPGGGRRVGRDVHAQVLAARGETDQAVEFLKAGDSRPTRTRRLPERIEKRISTC